MDEHQDDDDSVVDDSTSLNRLFDVLACEDPWVCYDRNGIGGVEVIGGVNETGGVGEGLEGCDDETVCVGWVVNFVPDVG